jgi:hypothetical protein
MGIFYSLLMHRQDEHKSLEGTRQHETMVNYKPGPMKDTKRTSRRTRNDKCTSPLHDKKAILATPYLGSIPGFFDCFDLPNV